MHYYIYLVQVYLSYIMIIIIFIIYIKHFIVTMISVCIVLLSYVFQIGRRTLKIISHIYIYIYFFRNLYIYTKKYLLILNNNLKNVIIIKWLISFVLFSKVKIRNNSQIAVLTH